jgi:hypothetical protein
MEVEVQGKRTNFKADFKAKVALGRASDLRPRARDLGRREPGAVSRLQMVLGYDAKVEDHRQAALREEADLKQLITEFIETYVASKTKHRETEFTAEAIVRLPRWQL